LGSCNPIANSLIPSSSTNAICPALTVANGFVFYDFLQPQASGTQATLLCNFGFAPSGTTVVTCDSNGAWSSNLGTCTNSLGSLGSVLGNLTTLNCPSLGTVANGQIFYLNVAGGISTGSNSIGTTASMSSLIS
jgi:hypothetical protein